MTFNDVFLFPRLILSFLTSTFIMRERERETTEAKAEDRGWQDQQLSTIAARLACHMTWQQKFYYPSLPTLVAQTVELPTPSVCIRGLGYMEGRIMVFTGEWYQLTGTVWGTFFGLSLSMGK